MKSPDQVAFKTILIITMIIAIVMLPFVAKAESQQRHSPPAFSDLDTSGDGRLNEAELVAGQKAHKQAMHEQHGKGMKMPTFGDLDLDGDGCINADEFARHQAERHGMHKAKDQ